MNDEGKEQGFGRTVAHPPTRFFVMAGKESGKIIAIDHNLKASIFHYADFGIVGEYQDVVPELIEKVKQGFTFDIEPVKH